MPVEKFVAVAVVNAAVPVCEPFRIAAAMVPLYVPLIAVTLPTLIFAKPLLLMLVTPVPASVVAIASKAASASTHTQAVLTLP